MKASKQMAEQGAFTEFTNGYPGGERNKMFGQSMIRKSGHRFSEKIMLKSKR